MGISLHERGENRFVTVGIFRLRQTGRVLHGRRRAALRPRQGVRQGLGLHDAGAQLPRPRARHLLGRGGAAGDEGEGHAAKGSVATT